MKTERVYELMFKSLAVLSFVSICWVMHRSLDSREECIHSDVVAEVVAQTTEGSMALSNCNYESRLSFSNFTNPPSPELLALVRRLQALDALAAIWPKPAPMLRIEIDFTDPFAFDMKPGLLKIGAETAMSQGQLERGVTLALLNTHFRGEIRSAFENEVTADFLLMAILDQAELQDPSSGEIVSFNSDTTFALTNRSVNEYCASSWKSLTHFIICSVQEPGTRVHDVSSWGTRPLIAKLLFRIYSELSLGEKIEVMRAVFAQQPLQPIEDLADMRSVSLADWTIHKTQSILESWGVNIQRENVNMALKRALVLERVSRITQWDYTVEISDGPQWELLWRGLKQWSQLNPSRHVLVWNPLGTYALPEGLPVKWSEKDVRTQKHLLVACKWPKAKDAISVSARHLVALQVCSQDQLPQWSSLLTPTSNLGAWLRFLTTPQS